MIMKEKRQPGGKSVRGCRGSFGGSRTVMVRIQGVAGGEPWGEIIHLHWQKPVPYRGLAEMIFRMDEIARYLGLCEDGPGWRSLRGDPEGENGILPEEYSGRISTEQRARDGFCRELHLKRARDVVCVELLGRHYMSLQGRLRCKGTGERYVYFRSALELMYLFAELSQDVESIHAVGETLEIK